MAILKVLKYGNELLKKKTKRVDFARLEKQLPKIIEDMTHTCLAMQGVGLAGPQAGFDLAIAVILMPFEKNGVESYKRYILINPQITLGEETVESAEGCLSFPGLDITVERAKEVTVKYTNEKGLPMELKAEGFLAIVLQHEADHLNGIVFTDRLKGAAKKEALAQIKELSKKWDN